MRISKFCDSTCDCALLIAFDDHLGLDGHVVGHVEAPKEGVDHVRLEQPHQVVLQRQVELRLARITLATGTTAQLVVDASGLVPLSRQHVETAEPDDLLVLRSDRDLRLLQRGRPRGLVVLRVLDRRQALLRQRGRRHELGVATKNDVGAATGHVRRDGHRSAPPGLRDDRRFALVVLGVQHLVRNAVLLEQFRQVLRLLDAGGADEDRLPVRVAFDDVLDDGVVLGVLGAVHEVRVVESNHVAIGRDRHNAELVDLAELGGFGHRRACHAGQLRVEAEEVLQGDRREGLVLGLDLDALLRLDRLVQALVVATAVQNAAGVLVDDEHLAVDDHVVAILLEQLLRADGVVEVADERCVQSVVEVVDADLILDLVDRILEHADGLLLLVDLIVGVALEERRDPGELLVPGGGLIGGTADDERRASLVDEDRVDLVDDGEVVPALDHLFTRPRHVVAQVVEAELVVRAVRDVSGVGDPSLGWRHRREDHAHLKAEESVDAAHPLRVALGEVVVDRDDVDAVAGQRVEVGRKGRH